MNRPATASLVDYLEESAARFPERSAIVDPAGWSLTYRELNERADRIAGFLIAKGVRSGDRVGVIVPKGVDAITAFIGIMKARAAYAAGGLYCARGAKSHDSGGLPGEGRIPGAGMCVDP